MVCRFLWREIPKPTGIKGEAETTSVLIVFYANKEEHLGRIDKKWGHYTEFFFLYPKLDAFMALERSHHNNPGTKMVHWKMFLSSPCNHNRKAHLSSRNECHPLLFPLHPLCLCENNSPAVWLVLVLSGQEREAGTLLFILLKFVQRILELGPFTLCYTPIDAH